MKLASKINLTVGAIVIPGSLLLSWLLREQAMQRETNRMSATRQAVSLGIASLLRNQTGLLEAQAKTLAMSPMLRALVSTPDVDGQTVLDSLTPTLDTLGLEDFCLADLSGKVMAQRSPGPPVNVPEASAAFAAASAGRVQGGLWMGSGPASLVVLCSVMQGEDVRGVMMVGRRLERALSALHEQFRGVDLVVSAGGRLLSPPPAWASAEDLVGLLESARARSPIDAWDSQTLTSFVTRRSGTRIHLARQAQPAAPIVNGTSEIAHWWILTDMTEPDASLRQIDLRISASALAMMVLLIGALGTSIARLLVRPVHEIAATFQRIAAGDLSHRVTVKSSDELELLSRSLNQMMVQMGELREREEARIEHERDVELQFMRARQSLEVARIYLDQGDGTQALTHLDGVTTSSPELLQAAGYMRIEARILRREEAVIEDLLEREDPRRMPADVATRLMGRVEQIGRYDLALRCLAGLEHARPGDPEAAAERHRLEELCRTSHVGAVMMKEARRNLGEDYSEVRFLKTGGMGMVVTTRWKQTGQIVAAKFMTPACSTSREYRRRFLVEIKSLMALEHPNIVRILEVLEGETLGYTMEFLDGENLASHFEGRLPLAQREVRAMAVQMFAGLHHAHMHGIVHRDVKPANFVRLPDGVVKLMDFGLARFLDATPVTRSGVVLGTPAYMCPDQRAGESTLGEEADVYSMAVILHEMLVGTLPSPWPLDPLRVAGGARPARLSTRLPGLPPGLASAIDHTLSFDRGARVKTCSRFLQELSELT